TLRARERGPVPLAPAAALLSRRHERRGVANRRAGPQDGARERSGGGAVVLRGVARERRVQEAEQAVASGASPLLHDLRARDEDDTPARAAPPSHEIRLLRIEEEALVEAARGLEGGPPHEQRGAHQRLDRPGA